MRIPKIVEIFFIDTDNKEIVIKQSRAIKPDMTDCIEIPVKEGRHHETTR